MAIESYIHSINQERDYKEALFDRIAELVIANYNQINPNVPLSQIQQVLRDGTVQKRGTIIDEEVTPTVIFEKDTVANSSDEKSFDGIVNHFSRNEEEGNVNVSLIGMTINQGEIFLTTPGLPDLQIGQDNLENLFINDNASQFISVSTQKNLLHIDGALEFLETSIDEFKPKYAGSPEDILKKRISDLFKDFDSIKKQIKKGETFQQGTNLQFIDKSAVSLNYLIKQCIDKIYDTKCIFTEEQYTTLLDQYNNLNTEFKANVSSSLTQIDVGADTIESKKGVVEEMTNVVFPQVLTSFNMDSYWKNEFSESLKLFVNLIDVLYSRVQRNIVINDSWKFRPKIPNARGWSIKQQNKIIQETVPDIDTDLESATTVGYRESEEVNGVYAGGLIDSPVTFLNGQFNLDHIQEQSGEPGPFIQNQPGCIRTEPQLFYYINPRGNRYPINTKNAIISTMATNPFLSSEWAAVPTFNEMSGPEIYSEGRNQIEVFTPYDDGNPQSGTVTEAYIMFVGSDKLRFNQGDDGQNTAMWDNRFSLDFIVAYRGGAASIDVSVDDNPQPSFTNPGYKHKWYWDNGLGFNTLREFIPNENDAIIARLYRTENSSGIEEINLENYTTIGNVQAESNIIPFTLYQNFWASNVLPPELSFQVNPSFNGETHQEYNALHLTYHPESGDSAFDNLNLNTQHFKRGETYNVSLYVKTETAVVLNVQPYIEVYEVVDENDDEIIDEYIKKSIHLVGTPLTFSESDGWKRMVFTDITVPQTTADTDTLGKSAYTINFRFGVGSDSSLIEDGTTDIPNLFTNAFDPIISVAGLQVEAGDISTAWRKPSERLQIDTVEETPSIEELTALYAGDTTDTIDTNVLPPITEDEFTFDPNQSAVIELEIPADNDNMVTILFKNTFPSIPTNDFRPGSIFRVNPQNAEYMMILEDEVGGNPNTFSVLRGVFNTTIQSHATVPITFYNFFDINVWENNGGDTTLIDVNSIIFSDEISSTLMLEIKEDSGNQSGNLIVATNLFGGPIHNELSEVGRILSINDELFLVRFYDGDVGGGITGLTRAFGGGNKKHHNAGSVIKISETIYNF